MAIEVGQQATVDRLRAAVDQLRRLTRAQLEEVAGLAELVQVDRGEVLAREGRIGRGFFLILSGKVASRKAAFISTALVRAVSSARSSQPSSDPVMRR